MTAPYLRIVGALPLYKEVEILKSLGGKERAVRARRRAQELEENPSHRAEIKDPSAFAQCRADALPESERA